MKFQSDRKPPPYLNRRDQYRLLAMVGVLCVVIAAMQWAGRPGTWHWLVPPVAEDEATYPALEEIDFRVLSQNRDPLAPDTIRAVAESSGGKVSSEAGGPADKSNVQIPESRESEKPNILDSRLSTLNSQLTNGPGLPDGQTRPPTQQHVETVEIPPDLLGQVEDNTLGLRRREVDAYHAMLSRIRELSDDVVAAHARDDIAFTVLMQEPDEYRGKLLTVRGELRRLTELPARADAGFDKLYEGWLFTRDSGTNPYRIIFTEKPGNFSLGESLDPPVEVRVTGYFFKRYGYASQGGQHVAPMLIAKSLSVMPRPVAAPADGSDMRRFMLGLIGVVIAAIAAMAWWFFLSDRRFRGSRLDQLAAARLDATSQDLTALQQVQTIDPDRPFADFDEERQSPPHDPKS